MKQKGNILLGVMCIVMLLVVSGYGRIQTKAAGKNKYFLSGQLYYKTVSDSKVEVCGTKTTEGTLIIPGKVSYKGKNYTVTGIANHKPYYQDVPVTEKTADGACVDIDFPGWKYYRYDRADGKSFPNGVEWISNCGIKKVVFPSTLTYIGDGAFGGCTKLKTVTFAKKYKKLVIGKNAFNGKKIKKIVFPEGTSELKENAAGVTPDIIIPATVKKIDAGVINYKTKNVTISKKNKKFKMKKGILYTKDERKLLGVSARAGENIKISNKTVLIGENAFAKSRVKKVALSSRITQIPKGAFAGCSKLETVTGTENVTEIGYAAFEGCTKLTGIGIMPALKKIGRAAFWNVNNLKLTVSSGMDIDNYAFSGTGYSTSVKVKVPEHDSKYAYVNGLLIKTEGENKTVIMQDADMEKIEVPEGVTEAAVKLGSEKCREIILPLSLEVQSGRFTVNAGTITFKNPAVPVFKEDFDIRNSGTNPAVVIVPAGSLAKYRDTMNRIVMKRDDIELFNDNLVIREQ